MFVIHEDMTIYATRGDAVYFQLEKKNGDAKYKFQPGDIVRFKVFGKKNCGKVVLMKDFLIEEESTAVNIFLDRGDMKFGEIISKPVDYWYEAELNPDTFPDTFVGYDADGPKLFKLFPEAKDVTEGEIDDPEESGAVERMVVTFVNEYLDANAEATINETVIQYIENHPIYNGEDGKDGVGVLFASIDTSGYLVLTYTDGKSEVVGRVVGKDGKDGFSPTAKVTETDSGAVITITDAIGTTKVTVKNGHDGADGTAGKDGKDGKNGADGKTPIKGEDYFTEAEKQEIIDEVLEQIPEGGGDAGSGVTAISVTEAADGTVTMVNTLSTGGTETIVISPDANGKPGSITYNGVAIPIEWVVIV